MMKKHKIIAGSALITGMIVLSGCNSNIDLCMTFDQDAYVTDDTIRVSAACSENADTPSIQLNDNRLLVICSSSTL